MQQKNNHYMIWLIGEKKTGEAFMENIKLGIDYANKKYKEIGSEIFVNPSNFDFIGKPDMLFGCKITPVKSVLINNVHICIEKR